MVVQELRCNIKKENNIHLAFIVKTLDLGKRTYSVSYIFYKKA